MSDAPLFSVLIPARDQRLRLGRTLDSIGRARFDPSRLQVVVVDDGSTDGTWEAIGARREAFDLRIRRVNHASQSATTNEALREATGEYVLSSAQDILFHPELFERHLAAHRRFPGEEVVVLGYLPYAPDLDVTPFMYYLVSGGYQFAYYLIRDPWNVPPNFLYAPNFSARRQLLVDVGGFDERFPYGSQDTDLAIRLQQRGVRIVYEPEAIGWHDHPVTLDGYRTRQERIGAALLHLQDKHPDHEGGPGLYDLVLGQYLMCSDARLDRLREHVELLEQRLREQGAGYQSLWDQAFCQSHGVGAFTDGERETLRTVDRLFKAYHAILGHYWAKGLLVEALAVHGTERVERTLDARLAKLQASIPARRAVEWRLRQHGLQRRLRTAADCRVSLIVHDVDGYAEALEVLESFDDPPASRCNVQVVLVLDATALSRTELVRLRVQADVVHVGPHGEGVLEAVTRCESDLVAVLSAKVEPVYRQAQRVAENLLAGVADVAVIGGAVVHHGSRTYGYRHDGTPLVAPDSEADRSAPIEVVVPECCWFRRSGVAELLVREPHRGKVSWNHRICELAARDRRAVVYVPQLAVRPRVPSLAPVPAAVGR